MKNYLWNMISIIQNGQLANASYVLQKDKKICRKFLIVLWDEGFILGFKKYENNSNYLKVFLKYINGKPAINTCRPVTKPGNKIYYSLKQIWKMNFITGILIISTNKGLLTIPECKQLKLGGQPFFVIK